MDDHGEAGKCFLEFVKEILELREPLEVLQLCCV
jgi:hypothetical protein